MANVGPIQVYTNLSNLLTAPDIARYFSAFTQQVANQFSNLLSQRMLSGTVTSGGSALIGQNYGVTMTSSGVYQISFTQQYNKRPAVFLTSESSAVIAPSGITTTGLSVLTLTPLGTPTQFSFLVRGDN